MISLFLPARISLPQTVKTATESDLADSMWSNVRHPPTWTRRVTVSVVPAAIVVGALRASTFSATSSFLANGL